MAETNGAGEAQPMTRDSLFPKGWELMNSDSEADTETDEAASAADDASELEGAEDDESKAEASEGTLGRMKLNEFLEAAGVSMEEFYRDVYVDVGGKEVSISQAWDAEKSSAKALDALSRERDELRAKVNSLAVNAPLPNESVESQLLLKQAEEAQKYLETTDWNALAEQHGFDKANAHRLDYISLRDSLLRQAQTKHQEHQAQYAESMQKLTEESDRQTRSLIPEWNDDSVMTTEWRSMKDLGAHYGFSGQEMDAWRDPRAKRILRDLMLARGQLSKVKAGARKIQKVSKTLGSGGRDTAKSQPSLEDVSRRIREASSKQDASKARQEMDLGPLPGIQQPTR